MKWDLDEPLPTTLGSLLKHGLYCLTFLIFCYMLNLGNIPSCTSQLLHPSIRSSAELHGTSK